MSITHFSVVNSVFSAIEEEDVEILQKLIDCWDNDDPYRYDEDLEVIARGLFYMFTRLKKLATRYGSADDLYETWRKRITQTAVDEELKFMVRESDDG